MVAAADIVYNLGGHAGENLNDLPLAASMRCYAGTWVGDSAGSGSVGGYARPLTAGDYFLGFCVRQSPPSDVAVVATDGYRTVRVLTKGYVYVTTAPTGLTAVSSLGSTVYANADNTLTMTSTSNTAVGKVSRIDVNSSGTVTGVEIYVEAVPERSI